MNFWWVNQNQTARQEVGGGYMWSPKRNKNGARNAFYENMRECAPGDVVFSFVDAKISTMGIVTSFCEESPKPDEFGQTGDQWDVDGWRVAVEYRSLSTPLRPASHMAAIGPVLPEKYSPLQADGRGNQVYLARVPSAMAEVLVGLIGQDAEAVVLSAGGAGNSPHSSSPRQDSRGDRAEAAIEADGTIGETEKQSLVKSRRGQGLFRERVATLEPRCRVTGVENPTYRIASHIKPWSRCSHEERLDGHNGLLLAPHIDHLFDNGFISFADDGTLLISPVADVVALERMGVPTEKTMTVGSFTEKQRAYLVFHREEVFKKSLISTRD
jgi:putative restriction endonuclease